MTFGERILYGSMAVTTFMVTGAAIQIRDAQAQELTTISVAGRDIELPENVKLRGWTYSVRGDCLNEHPTDSEEACRKIRKYVLRSGETLGSVIEDDGEIWMVTGNRDQFDFIKEWLDKNIILNPS